MLELHVILIQLVLIHRWNEGQRSLYIWKSSLSNSISNRFWDYCDTLPAINVSFRLFCRLQKAFWEAYKLAIENFNQISVTAACIFFVDLLCMDSYSVRVDIESANFILHNYSMENNDEFDSEEKLKMFIGKIFFLYQVPSIKSFLNLFINSLFN